MLSKCILQSNVSSAFTLQNTLDKISFVEVCRQHPAVWDRCRDEWSYMDTGTMPQGNTDDHTRHSRIGVPRWQADQGRRKKTCQLAGWMLIFVLCFRKFIIYKMVFFLKWVDVYDCRYNKTTGMRLLRLCRHTAVSKRLLRKTCRISSSLKCFQCKFKFNL